jgi:predicted TIM-barrel fold metal-dependent hydrolase
MDSSGVGWLPFFCESISWAGADRVLYGSDTPFNPMEWEIEKIVKRAQAASEAQDRRSPPDYVR